MNRKIIATMVVTLLFGAIAVIIGFYLLDQATQPDYVIRPGVVEVPE